MTIFLALLVGMAIILVTIPSIETCAAVSPPPVIIEPSNRGSGKEVKVGDKRYFPWTDFSNLAKSILKIKLDNSEGHKEQGTAFLCHLPIGNGTWKLPGLMTNAHVLNEEHLQRGVTLYIEKDLGGSPTEAATAVSLKSDITRWYVGDVGHLDATFIQVKDEVMKELTKDGAKPLEITAKPLRLWQSIKVLQHPNGGVLSISNGQIVDIINGSDVKHDASTDPGSSGSPLLDFETLKVIGIHTGGSNGENLNLAVSMTSVVAAILKDFTEANKFGCDVPSVENGRITQRDSNSVGMQLEIGMVIFLTCNAGYAPPSVQETTKTCLSSGELMPKLPLLRCEPLPGCPSTPTVDHGQIAAGPSTVGTILSILCDDGYVIQGAISVYCQTNRTWTQPGQCLMDCGPPAIDNGNVGDGSSLIGSSRRIVCYKGHSLVGSNGTIVCQSSGLWENAACIDYEAWFAAAERGNLEQVKNFVRSGANSNQKNGKDRAALHYCGEKGYIEMAEFLLQNGANVDEIDSRGETPLMWACQYGHMQVAQVFVSNSANVNAKNKKGSTPLMKAAINGNDEIVRWLVNENQPLNINEKNIIGQTALKYAIDRKNFYKEESERGIEESEKKWFKDKEAACDRITEFLRSKGATT